MNYCRELYRMYDKQRDASFLFVIKLLSERSDMSLQTGDQVEPRYNMDAYERFFSYIVDNPPENIFGKITRVEQQATSRGFAVTYFRNYTELFTFVKCDLPN